MSVAQRAAIVAQAQQAAERRAALQVRAAPVPGLAQADMHTGHVAYRNACTSARLLWGSWLKTDHHRGLRFKSLPQAAKEEDLAYAAALRQLTADADRQQTKVSACHGL